MLIDKEREKKRISEVVSTKERREQLLGSWRRTSDEKRRLRAQRERAEAEQGQDFVAAFSGRPDQEKAKALRILSVVLIAIDIPLQIILSRTAFPQLHLTLACLLGAGTAIALGLITEHVTYVATFDALRPRQSVRTCLWLGAASGFVSLLGASVLMYCRSASDVSAELVSYMSLSLWMVGEAAALTGGFLAAAHRSYAISSELATRIDELDRALDALTQYEAWLADELAKLKRGKKDKDDDDPRGGAAAAPTIRRKLRVKGENRKVAAAALALLLISGRVMAQSEGLTCALYVDETASVSKAGRGEALRRLQASLPVMAASLACSTLRVAWFRDESYLTPFVDIPVPEPVDRTDCAKAPIVVKGTREALLQIEGVRRGLQRDATAACEARQRRDLVEYAAKERVFRREVEKHLLPPATFSEKDSCLYELLDDLLSKPNLVPIILSDLDENCAPDELKQGAARGDRAVFVAIPGEARQGRTARQEGAALRRRMSAWKRLLPNARIAPYTEVSESFWRTAIKTADPVTVAAR